MWVEKHGKAFRIRERFAGEIRTVESGYPTKTAARQAMKLLDADQLRGDLVLPSAGRVTLADWVGEWWDSREDGLSPSTQKSEGSRVRNMILPRLGLAELGEIQPMTVQRWVKDLVAAGYAAKTIHNAHGVLHTALDSAVANRLIKANPCAPTKLPKGEHREMRFLTPQEAERLLAATPGHYRPLIVTALGTGLRWAELAGLRVHRVDVLAGKLRVEETLNELSDGLLTWGPPKTRASRRTVKLPDEVAQALVGLVANRGRGDVVFTALRGGELRVRNFRRVWLRALDDAGLEPARDPGARRTEGVRFHDLRHTHASWLISAGRPLTAISRRLGHTSISITSDRYGHLLPDVDDGIIEVLDAALPRSTWEQNGSSGTGTVRSNPDEDGATRRSAPVRVA